MHRITLNNLNHVDYDDISIKISTLSGVLERNNMMTNIIHCRKQIFVFSSSENRESNEIWIHRRHFHFCEVTASLHVISSNFNNYY